MPINQENFDIAKQLFNNSVFVITTFQRPYSWDDSQLQDLIFDIKHAATSGSSQHYLSPIHVIKIKNPTLPEWLAYTDSDNPDLNELTSSVFQDREGLNQNIYLVVDGQQRLTTLFLLFYAKFGTGTFTALSGKIIPRMILNPANDHAHFRNLLGLTSPFSHIASRSQGKISDIFNSCKASVKSMNPSEINVLQNGLKTLLIELDTHYGLRGFLTLNDRGKQLTHFEKFKSLLMEYDILFGAEANPQKIHHVFGKGYGALDAVYSPLRPSKLSGDNKSLFTDDRLLGVLSIDVWMRAEILNESAEYHFSRYRKANPAPADVGNWLDKLDQLVAQIVDLTSHLVAKNNLASPVHDLTLNRTVHDHYRVICDSLGLSDRSMAFALKFRAEHGGELHERKYDITVDNSDALNLIQGEARDLVGAISGDPDLTADSKESLNGIINVINLAIAAEPSTSVRKMSVLDLAEWIELFVVQMGSRLDYVTTWRSAFSPNKSDQVAIGEWAWYATNYGARRVFFSSLLSQSVGVNHRKVVSHLLAEYESALRVKNISQTTGLAHGEHLDLEHFLPSGTVNGMPPFPWCGIQDINEYSNICNTLGNLLLLDAPLNRALQSQIGTVKLAAYGWGIFGTTTATVITEQSTRFTSTIGIMSPTLKYALRIRRLELMIFALKRF